MLDRHLQLLFPHDYAREHFLNCLSFLFKNRGQKIMHAFVLVGHQGTGKSMMLGLIESLFGESNVCKVESEQLSNRFQAGLANVEFASIEELNTFEKGEVYNRLKSWITQRHIRVEDKGVRFYTAKTPNFFFATSNYAMPVRLGKGDRRFFIYESPMVRPSDEYYNELARAVRDEASGFLNSLLLRDLSGFNENAPPPMTETKANIISMSRPQVEQEIEALMSDDHHAFWSDLVNVNEVRKALRMQMRRDPTVPEITNALRELGGKPLKPVRMGDGKSVRLWAMNNVDRWREANPSAIRSYLTDLRPQL